MWIFAIILVAAILIVFVTRGSFLRLAHLPISSVWLLVFGIAFQVAIDILDLPTDLIENLGYAVLMISYVLLLAFCLVNLPLRGMSVITLGVALNALVIGLNVGMPTKAVSLDASGKRVAKPIEQSVKHRPASPNDLLGFLGDKILLPQPFDELVSIGDVVLALGVCELAYYGSRRPRDVRGARTRQRAGLSAPRRSRTRSSALRT